MRSYKLNRKKSFNVFVCKIKNPIARLNFVCVLNTWRK